ncbi:zinc finger protein 510-like [Athalia rosae]|uniref:zinc finger protein 510-like n=1 Tax=Athalia rosae TaxID=37344 RepID=UPI00203391C3|nr:zinc finger protein 510-like [Athalia rosae]
MASSIISGTMKLGSSSAIHVGPIVTSGSNEIISIVIPLSAQMATMTPGQVVVKDAYNDCRKDFSPTTSPPEQTCAANNAKGCPFPKCSRYGRAFSRAHDLKRHMARHEAKKERLSATMNEEKHHCLICGEHFLSEAVLKKHSQIHERTNNQQVLLCYICKNKYENEKKLKAHLATHDKKSMSTMCALCGLRFDENGELQVHMREHTSSIVEGQSTLADLRSLSQLEYVDEEFFTGDQSQEKINENASVAAKTTKNVNKNANDTTSGKIRCDYCWKTFKSKWTLNSHVAAHEGRFQYNCDQCGKKFVRKSHFEGHVRSHEATRPYACDVCGSTFKQAKHRREHFKRKHPGTQNAVQNLLNSISACVSEESSVDQPKFTLLVPVEFNA